MKSPPYTSHPRKSTSPHTLHATATTSPRPGSHPRPASQLLQAVPTSTQMSPTARTASPHVADLAMAPAPLGTRKLGAGSASNSPTPYSRENNNNNRSASTSPSDDRKRYQFDAPNDDDVATPTQSGAAAAAAASSRPQSVWMDDPAMDPAVRLEEYEWAELEAQFERRMEAMRAVEEGVWEEWRGWGEIFGAWASTISVHDEDRASKRLRTRIAFTQGSEGDLEGKRQHYIKVVQAFESALALLGNG